MGVKKSAHETNDNKKLIMAIYTSICGAYDKPRTDVKCFTEEKFENNPRLSAKIYKCLPHLFMPDEEWHIWIDGNLELKVDEKELIKLAGKSDVTVFENPYRNTVGEEMEEIKRLKLDDPEIVDAQTYNKNDKLPACFLIIRRNTPEVARRNAEWWAEICAGSVRDQISFPHCYVAKYLDKVDPFNNSIFKRHGHIIPRG